ncbi:MAG: hypothetical protein JWO60_2328 [Frankiales bacterium]|nr:hypothetical protein [Frankiales bacterium]
MLRSSVSASLLTLALAGSLAACGSGSSGGSEPDLAPAAAVRAAADTSTDAGSSKFSLTSSTVVQGKPLDITGTGAFDYAAKEGTLSLKLPVGTVEQRVVDGNVYLALSQQPGVFYKLSLTDVQGTSLGGSTDPGASFQSLQAVTDDVEVVGEEEVRDAATTHYRGTLDVKKALATTDGAAKQVAEATLGRAGVEEVPFDAWLDDDGRLRKYVQVLDVPAGPTTGGQPVKSTTTLELFDFGTDVAVTAPPASAVKDGAPLLEALKGGARAGG